MRRNKLYRILVLILIGIGLTIFFRPWEFFAFSIEDHLNRIKPAMTDAEVTALLGKPEQIDMFTRSAKYVGPPSLKPAVWDLVPEGTTVTHWMFFDNRGTGVVAFTASDMRVITKWFNPRGRPVPGG